MQWREQPAFHAAACGDRIAEGRSQAPGLSRGTSRITSKVWRKLMGRRWLRGVILPAFLIAAAPATFPTAASAQATRAVDESFFVEQLHPVLHAVQCEQCHN